MYELHPPIRFARHGPADRIQTKQPLFSEIRHPWAVHMGLA
jgi:hypothetical protein